jgi:hypothetical protein
MQGGGLGECPAQVLREAARGWKRGRVVEWQRVCEEDWTQGRRERRARAGMCARSPARGLRDALSPPDAPARRGRVPVDVRAGRAHNLLDDVVVAGG